MHVAYSVFLTMVMAGTMAQDGGVTEIAPQHGRADGRPGFARRVVARLWPHRSVLLLAFAAMSILTVWLTAHWARLLALDEIRERSAHELVLVVENLRGELAKFAFQPKLLSAEPAFLSALQDRATAHSIQAANLELERVADVTGALDVYLMNKDGRTIAASNWAAARSFIGRNFDYRPYFQAAMEGRLGRFFALGSTSLERGYYFAYPVRDPGGDGVIGALVVKMGVAQLERKWRSSDGEVLVIDDAGVVFLSTQLDWRLKSIGPLTPASRRRLTESRRYLAATIDMLEIEPRVADGAPRFEDVASEPTHQIIRIGGARYLALSTMMHEAGWRVVVLADASDVDSQTQTAVLLAILALASLALAAAAIYQRQRRFAERLALQEAARANLELRVDERTRAISAANAQQRGEVAERQRAEAELRHAQDELVQASKLAALGQMAAGLSHELNQPLAAIRGYADNARTFLEREDAHTAGQNLSAIAELTDRMARIIQMLRAFARKGPIELRPVRLAPVIQDALILLESRRAASGANITLRGIEADPWVIGGAVRLQQVLVNLISNALDAMAEAPERRLTIELKLRPETVEIVMTDTGPGIADEAVGRVFDPFFSTKRPGEGDGMGLGLSISYAIVERLGGRISAGSAPDGGARFCVTLRRTAAESEIAAELTTEPAE